MNDHLMDTMTYTIDRHANLLIAGTYLKVGGDVYAFGASTPETWREKWAALRGRWHPVIGFVKVGELLEELRAVSALKWHDERDVALDDLIERLAAASRQPAPPARQ